MEVVDDVGVVDVEKDSTPIYCPEEDHFADLRENVRNEGHPYRCSVA